ncbi:ZinT family metal-binding protein [Marinilactibacillus kalidii]|uniref:ZinT family metal-binding protein n=1 Tax=Marinilactibacillus kalidii TaxID=2820274 RepID=UPI001ABDDB58|nr:ZinT/AdcA family metal-binding protein [Marinilactibacillus kalidii]
MMYKGIKVSGIVSMGLLLAACQETSADDTNEQQIQEQAVPSTLEVKGMANHYHTGDEIELTAKADEELAAGNLQWYIKGVEASDWTEVSGMTSADFSREATESGLQIKVAYLGEEAAETVESEPVEVEIDDHGANDEVGKRIYNGFFYNDEIEDRPLTDWAGDWQSVYPYLQSGALDEVFEEKANNSDTMNAEEYKDYYDIGYVTDVDRMVIDANSFTFYQEDGTEMSAEYDYDGYEVLNYERGNRGVRYVFNKVGGSEDMPEYIQFSDHDISEVEAHHYHLYWGDDRAELLEEVENWPTYYPSDLDEAGIVRDMLAH